MRGNSQIGIIGLGKFGMYLAFELVKNKKSIICLDKDENKIKRVQDISDASYVVQDLSVKTLEETGFKECDLILICISEHLESAIFATLNALQLNSGKVIAISNSEDQGRVLETLGAEVIYPFKDSVSRLVKKIMNNNFLDYISLSDDVEIVEIECPKSLIGTTVLESDIRQKYGLNIIAIEMDDKIETRIDPSYHFKKGDCLVLIGDVQSLKKFENIK